MYYLSIYLCGDKVAVVGIGHSNSSSNLIESVYILHCTNTLGTGKNPTILQAMGK